MTSTIQQGQTVTIRQGKLSGTKGVIVHVSPDQTAAVELENGRLVTQKLTNLKMPEVPTVTETELADVLNRTAQNYSGAPDALHALATLADYLGTHLPDFAARLYRAATSAEARADV